MNKKIEYTWWVCNGNGDCYAKCFCKRYKNLRRPTECLTKNTIIDDDKELSVIKNPNWVLKK